MLLFVLYSLFVVYLIIVLIVSYLMTLRKKAVFNIVPVYCTIGFLVVIFVIKCFTSELFESPVKIEASVVELDSVKADPLYLGYRLKLRENGRYLITALMVEAACSYKGKYLVNHDTLYLEKSFILDADSTLSNKYFVDKTIGFIKPVNSGTNKIDYSKCWFQINQ